MIKIVVILFTGFLKILKSPPIRIGKSSWVHMCTIFVRKCSFKSGWAGPYIAAKRPLETIFLITQMELHIEFPFIDRPNIKISKSIPNKIPPDWTLGSLQCHKKFLPPHRFLRTESAKLILPVFDTAIKHSCCSLVKSEINLCFLGSLKPLLFLKKSLHLENLQILIFLPFLQFMFLEWLLGSTTS
jgi:hypothetical protein